MELVYLWVEEYKNIHKEGFNFSPRFNCEYNPDSNELTIDENDDYIENFFGNNINVTAIVGKNGSGKSSLLEILFYKTKFKCPNKITFFIVFFQDRYYVYLFENGGLLLKKEISMDSSINIKSIKEEKDTNRNITEYDYLSIFYSNIYSQMPMSIPENGKSFVNISTSHLTQKDASQSSSIKNILNMLKNADIDLPMKIPSDLRISLNCKFFNDNDNIISQKFKKLEHTLSKSNNTFFYNYLITELLYQQYNINEIREKEIKEIDSFEKLDELFSQKFKDHVIYNNLYNIAEIIKTLSVEGDLTIKLSRISDIKIIEKIVETMNTLKNNFNVLRLSFDIKMSTGEEAFLFQFANIYASLKEPHIQFLSDNQYSTNDITLLIDEGESTLHPQWQKVYLSYLIYFLSKNVPEIKFHLIFTTHSPFLLSDIPKQNIIFLDTNEDGNCKVVDGLNEKKETFGANIHTLLSDSFFMDGGLMGEFAKGKIDKAIKYLNQEKLNEKELKYCEQIISIIGEPIVKNQLQRMLDSKRLKKVDEIDAIKQSMEAMQKRLDELEK